MIKTVAKELLKEFPEINEFVTLSPVFGFMDWIKIKNSSYSKKLKEIKWLKDGKNQNDILKLVFDFLINSIRTDGMPNDPVARFHLGNGAIIERINLLGDLSEKAMKESAGLMINYKYDLKNVERNHEEFFKSKAVVFSTHTNKMFAQLNRNKPEIL